jgi:hypothetical protein
MANQCDNIDDKSRARPQFKDCQDVEAVTRPVYLYLRPYRVPVD